MSLMDALEGVGYVVDTPRALTHGLVAKLGDALRGKPIRDSWRASGREMLESLGVLGPNQDGLDAGDVLGFGAEMALDPLNLLGGAGILKSLKSRPIRFSGKASEEVLKKLPMHTVDDLRKIASGDGIVKLYHGSPAKNATAIVNEGVSLSSSGEDAARKLASLYGIPWTEWKHKYATGAVDGGFGESTARLSTATAPVASKWASHFPNGEVYDVLNDEMRVASEARRRGVSVDDVWESLPDIPQGSWGHSKLSSQLDAAGVPNLLPGDGYGHIVSFDVDARAIPRRVRREAEAALRAIRDMQDTVDDGLATWNGRYKDIKIHPKHAKNPRLLIERGRVHPAMIASLLGYNVARNLDQ